MEIKPTTELDCIGFYCPIPIIKTRELMDTMQPGDILKIEADDPAAEADLKIWAKRTGNRLLQFTRQGAILTFLIEKVG
ncbi:MAG: sulfurtransferase TusA family protein [bacterium]|nr:sulfurtransferase TusA family protein [bacterium]